MNKLMVENAIKVTSYDILRSNIMEPIVKKMVNVANIFSMNAMN